MCIRGYLLSITRRRMMQDWQTFLSGGKVRRQDRKLFLASTDPGQRRLRSLGQGRASPHLDLQERGAARRRTPRLGCTWRSADRRPATRSMEAGDSDRDARGGSCTALRSQQAGREPPVCLSSEASRCATIAPSLPPKHCRYSQNPCRDHKAQARNSSARYSVDPAEEHRSANPGQADEALHRAL